MPGMGLLAKISLPTMDDEILTMVVWTTQLQTPSASPRAKHSLAILRADHGDLRRKLKVIGVSFSFPPALREGISHDCHGEAKESDNLGA
mmetsp:Transcript_72000/g.114149  ORF Transcript_72000/g.114149 Transcript_72000/m.114149 type:complete len:90 (-) Transcript_72000:18-287(-)